MIIYKSRKEQDYLESKLALLKDHIGWESLTIYMKVRAPMKANHDSSDVI